MQQFRFAIRPVAIFAGIIGALQSAAWIAMCITGITAYYCHMNLEDRPNALGSIFELTFFKVYFAGPCDQQIVQNVDFANLENLDYMKPWAVHGVIWAYLMLSFFWFISSITLITSVRYKYVRFANIFLFTWITLTSLISILDLSFGILFGIDYGTFMTAAFEVQLNPIGNILVTDAVLLGAQASAGVMMGVAFRGFLLWIVNVALVCYFFTQTLEITDYNRAQENAGGMENFGYGADKATDPYGFGNQSRSAPLWFSQQESTSRSGYPTIPHVETRNRPPPPPPPMMPSMDTRRRDDDVVLRNNNVVREINDRNSLNVTRRNEPNPDYSPPMPRNNNPYDRQRSMMRGSRL